MLSKGNRRMSGRYHKGQWTWKWNFLLLWILVLANLQPNVLGYFLGDLKAVLNGCEDHWTLQDKAAFPLLYKMTVCVNIRVVVPGPWMAFTYSSIHGLMPELGLEGDEGALSAWLLRVKHRFPVKLSQQDWHKVCLRRDVVGSSFSLEVDDKVVGHRVVIAQAIPAYGSLWLGCGQRDQSLGAGPGQVELYLFRVWSDLDRHGSCEDGSVIGWTSEFWGVTSANARQKDPNLPCVHRSLPCHRYRRQMKPNAAASPVSTTQSPGPITKRKLTCHLDQLCSNNYAYFWIPVSVRTEEEAKSERDIHEFMSRVFNCDGKGNFAATTRSDFDIFCQHVNQIKIENVSCVIKDNISESHCGIVVQLSPIVSACKLQQAGLSALQQASDKQIKASLTGAVERVGRNLCEDPNAGGGFVNCSVTMSLNEMCQSNKHSTLTCTVLEPDYIPVKPPVTTDTCKSEETHFCNCTTFCNSPSHFYAQRLNIMNIDTKFIQNMLTTQELKICGKRSSLQCMQDVLKNQGLKKTYVNCQKNKMSYSCMMTLEMTKPITNCSTVKVLQMLINSTKEVTSEGSLNHMVVCGDRGKPIETFLTSNLTWFYSNLNSSDLCKVNQTLLKCAANENLAVLLSDPCPSPLTFTVPPPITTPSATTTTHQTTTKTTITTSVPTTTVSATFSTTTTHSVIQTTTLPTIAPFTEETTSTTTQSVPFTFTTLQTTSDQTLHTTKANLMDNTATTTALSSTKSDATTAKTFSSTTNEVSNPSTAKPTTASTVGETTTFLTTSNKATTTFSSTPATTANTIDTTTVSTTMDRVTKATTAKRNETITTNKSGTTTVGGSSTVSTTTTGTTTGNMAGSTTAANTTTAKVLDNTTSRNTAISTTTDNQNIVDNTASSTTPTVYYKSTTIATDTIGNNTTYTTVNTADSTTLPSTIYTTTPAPKVNSTAKTINTSINTVYTTTMAHTQGNTTQVITTTTSNTINNATTASIYQTISSQSIVNNTTTTSSSTKATSSTAEPNFSTMSHETTMEALTTSTKLNTTTPKTSSYTANQVTKYNTTQAISSQPSTTSFNESSGRILVPLNVSTVNTTTTTSPLPLTQSTHMASTTLTSTTTDDTITNVATQAQVSESTTTQAIHTVTIDNVTTAQIYTSTPEQPRKDSTTTVPHDTSNLQRSTIISTTITTTTTLPTSTRFSVTATVYNETGHIGMQNNNTLTNNTTSTTAIPMTSVSKKYNESTTADTITTSTAISTFTTTYIPKYNVTKNKENRDNITKTTTTRTRTTTYTPFISTAGYNVTKSVQNYTKMPNISTTIMPVLNITVTPMPNYTITEASDHATAAHTNTTTLSESTTVKINATEAVTMGPQTTPSTTAVTHANNVTKTTYVNVTEPTPAPPGDLAGESTTPTMSNMTTADWNGTVQTTSTTPISNQATVSSTDNRTTTINTHLTTTTEVSTTGAAMSSKPTTTPSNTATTTATTTTTTTTTAPAATTTTTTTTTNQPTQDRTDITTEALQTSTTSSMATTKLATEQSTRTPLELEEEADNLLFQTADVSQLNSSQVAKLVGQLESLLDGPTISKAVGKKAINIISNLMEGDAEVLSATANRLVRLVDNLGLKLEVPSENEILTSTSLVLAVQVVDGSNFPTTAVNILSTDNVQLNNRGTRLTGGPLASVFLPSSLTEGLSPDQQHQASRVQFTFYTKSTLFQDTTLNNQTIVSPILGSSVANLSISNLKENIEFTIRNVNPIKTNHSISCVFWDFAMNGGGGGWNNDGCHLMNATPEDTSCSCNHLTSFAVLLDLSREGVTDRQQAQILTFITYIGCGVSAAFLSVTILTYLAFEKLRRDIPAKILVQLCISLLLLNLLFLLDGWLALYKVKGLCISTAFFLHYFLLTSFTWAGLEALHMYLSIVRVFTPYLSQYMMKFSIMGWGIPLIVVIIIIAVDKNNYGLVSYGRYSDGTTDDFCWLRNDTAFYVGVVAYFLLIFALCLIVFIVVLLQLARIKRQNPQNQSPNRGLLTDLRSISGLIVLLGLTWGFALFAWGPLYLPFIYLFSIFNSLQGLFVFIFHCAVKENVQRQWRTYLCCGKLRLAENSEWSRTATHNNRNTSFAMMSSSAAHLTSSSASVISESTSSGSVYADSGISDSSNSDVVMNEIHRRNMALQGNL